MSLSEDNFVIGKLSSGALRAHVDKVLADTLSTMRKLIFLILCLLPFCALSQEFYLYKYDVTVEILANGTSYEKLNIFLQNKDNKEQDITHFFVSGDIYGLSISDDAKELNYTVKKSRWNTKEIEIYLQKPLKRYDIVELTIRYARDDLVRIRGNELEFTSELAASEEIKKLRMSVKIPQGYSISNKFSQNNSGFVEIIKPAAQIKTDSDSVFVQWDTNDVKAGEKMRFSLLLERIRPQRHIIEKSVINEGIVFILLILGIGIGYIASNYVHKKHVAQEQEHILSVLDENEQIVIRELINSENPLTQRELRRITGFSKAKLSRIISNLAERNIIEKHHKGKTNEIILAQEALKE